MTDTPDHSTDLPPLHWRATTSGRSGVRPHVQLHWRGLVHVPFLRSAVAVSLRDATLAAIVYLVLLPVLAIALCNPWLLPPSVTRPTAQRWYGSVSLWLRVAL
jgi:hypothetical protein